MSKQDIEKRLGFAAQGVKETTRTSAKATFAGHDAFVVTQNYNGSATGTIKGFDSLQQAQAYIKERRAAIAAKATPEEAKTVSWTIHKTIDEAGNSQTVGTVKFARPGVKAKFGTDSISVNMIAKRMVSKLKKIVPNEGLEQFHKRLLARINEIVKSTEEAIRNPDDANLQWTIQELKDVIRDEAGSSGSLNRATGVWLGSRPGVKAKMAADPVNGMGLRHVYKSKDGKKEARIYAHYNTYVVQFLYEGRQGKWDVKTPRLEFADYSAAEWVKEESAKSARPGVKAKA